MMTVHFKNTTNEIERSSKVENKREEKTYTVALNYTVTVSARTGISATNKAMEEIEEGLWEPEYTEARPLR